MLNTVLPAMAAMAGQPPGADGVRGRIAVIASIAAFAATPWAPSYAASKAAADLWTVGSAPAALRRGVVLTSVCPGYIRTAMTAGNRLPMPGLMDAGRAAAHHPARRRGRAQQGGVPEVDGAAGAARRAAAARGDGSGGPAAPAVTGRAGRPPSVVQPSAGATPRMRSNRSR
ncbi:MAG: SDR family NAD(P)-dependent oxidoreductase [Acetobacteraceae bacterium]